MSARAPFGRASVIRIGGFLLIGCGLILIGVSGDNHRVANGRNLSLGAALAAAGTMLAFFAN